MSLFVPPSESAKPKAAAGTGANTASDVPLADVPQPEPKDRQPSDQTLAAPPSQAGDTRLATSGPTATPPATPPAAPATIVPLEAAAGPGWRLEADAPGAVTARSDAPPPAAGPQPVAQQIAAAVARASDGQVEVRLDPPELGRVQIRMETTDDGVRAVVLAERPETQDLLRRNADQLARDLGSAGFERVSLDFSAGGQAAARRDRAVMQFAAAGQGGSAETPPPDAARPRLSAAGGLDIRL
jgi:flagellar hook-length control protein FliK